MEFFLEVIRSGHLGGIDRSRPVIQSDPSNASQPSQSGLAERSNGSRVKCMVKQMRLVPAALMIMADPKLFRNQAQ
ncbi:MAG: hypothetical protein CMM01_22840 [Rhodopirellula sp.]|nr:hypothetical protein [Rhodopirellula sp.]